MRHLDKINKLNRQVVNRDDFNIKRIGISILMLQIIVNRTDSIGARVHKNRNFSGYHHNFLQTITFLVKRPSQYVTNIYHLLSKDHHNIFETLWSFPRD